MMFTSFCHRFDNVMLKLSASQWERPLKKGLRKNYLDCEHLVP